MSGHRPVERIGRVVAVNVGPVREIEWHGRTWRTGIFKAPLDAPVRVQGVQMAGDEQADLSVHGGPTRAVYAYPREHYAWWRRQLAPEQAEVLDTHGAFGENLTTEGVLETEAGIGDLFRIGTALLRVTEPRLPCAKLGLRFDDATMTRRFQRAARNGLYLAIEEPGEVTAGDAVTVEYRHPTRLTTHDIVEYHAGRNRTENIRSIATAHPALSDSWRTWFAEGGDAEA